jgi:hypothetical protein
MLGSRIDVACAYPLVTALRFAMTTSGALDALRTIIRHVTDVALGVLSCCWHALLRHCLAKRSLRAMPRLRSRPMCLVVSPRYQLFLLLLALWHRRICNPLWNSKMSSLRRLSVLFTMLLILCTTDARDCGLSGAGESCVG